MSTTTSARRFPLHTLAVAPLAAAALLIGTGGAPQATATAPRSAPSQQVTIKAQPVAYVSASVRAARGRTAVKIAAAQQGDPYRYGAAGPSAFDCSGLVYYTFRTRLGVAVPRTANSQRLASVRISKSNLQQGDLIFFMSGGRAYHVGIYAGYGKVWHSPKPGSRVQLVRIWTSSWVAGRMP